jgi:hypothetical protein
VSILTRVAVAGSIVLSLAFTALVAWAHPGRAKSTSGVPRHAPEPVSTVPATSRARTSDDAPVTVPASTTVPTTSPADTVPPSVYTPQPYYGSSGGGIVSGQT